MHWLFLRGLTRESRHWGVFPSIFHDAVGGAEIVLLDLPGNGEFCSQTSPADICGMVEHCRRELQRRSVSPPFGMLAMSLGAMVCIDWMTRYPEEVHAAVLINTSLRPYNPFFHRLRPHNYAPLLRLLAFRQPDAGIERAILEMTSRKHGNDGRLLADWIRWREQSPVLRRNALRQLLAAVRYRAPRCSPSQPLLLLASAGDRLVAPCCSVRLAALWQANLAVHPDAGHDLPLDDPCWVAGTVAHWLRRGVMLTRATEAGPNGERGVD